MIRYSEVNWSTPGVKQNRIDNNIEGGKPLAFIIDSEVVLTMATDRWFADFMETVDEFREPNVYEHEGEFFVNLIKDGEILFHIDIERLSNIKYDWYPFLALSKIKDYVDHVDVVAIAGVGPLVPGEYFEDTDIYTTFIRRLGKTFFNNNINHTIIGCHFFRYFFIFFKTCF